MSKILIGCLLLFFNERVIFLVGKLVLWDVDVVWVVFLDGSVFNV